MINELKEQFDISYENGASDSYLVISTNLPEVVLKYQVEMIRNNSIHNMLALDIRQKDNTVSFYYNITSRISLTQLLKRKKFKRNEFIGIISGITKALLDCKGYLLYERCVLLNADYIYISPDTLQISVVYLPVKMNFDINSKFRDFMMSLIIDSANIDDNGSDNFLQRIINRLRMETFNIGSFQSFLMELLQSDSFGHVSEASCSRQDILSEEKDRQSTAENGKIIKPERFGRPPVQKREACQAEIGAGAVSIAAFIFFQVAIVALILFGHNHINSMNDDPFAVYSGIGVILIALEVLVYKKLFVDKIFYAWEDVKKKKIGSPAAKSKNDSMQEKSSMTGHINEVFKGKPGTINKKAEEKDLSIKCLPQDEASLPVVEIRNETVLLELSKEKYAYLQSDKNGLLEKIQISKSDFIIGRLKDQVDYPVKNNAIGKLHAQIIFRDNSYYIKDLNSRNGTFINGARINSNKEYEIRHNDRVTLANSDYIFIIPQEINSMTAK